jgi:hypothetical protein
MQLSTILVAVVLVVALVVIGPLLTIWSANTLFPALAIPYTFDTWCAVILLGMFLRANVTTKK